MAKFPPTMQRLIEEFSALPTIGPKTAERFVFYLLKNKDRITGLQEALENLKTKVTTCETCHTFSEKSPCYICSNPKRDQSAVCVVANTTDLAAIENTNNYNGLYHVLGGSVNPLEDQQRLNVETLINRIKNNEIKEIILAFNPDIEGESTIIYLQKLLKPLGAKISRLAKGLPMGSDLIYADEITLSSALEERKEL
ncbi:MAG: recombination mediator RecR [Patescibacteria group bacterium]|jgi:recombination protein RecR